MDGDAVRQANEETRQAWNENAAFWDQRMGEGNDFVEVLVWPATERLLDLKVGERVLDIACGNGLTSRRLAAPPPDIGASGASKIRREQFADAVVRKRRAFANRPRSGFMSNHPEGQLELAALGGVAVIS